MTNRDQVLRGVVLPRRQLYGLRSVLLEAITSEILMVGELSLARVLHAGVGEILQIAALTPNEVEQFGILLPAAYIHVASLSVEHALTTVLPFGTSMRVHLDVAELESLWQTLIAASERDSA